MNGCTGRERVSGTVGGISTPGAFAVLRLLDFRSLLEQAIRVRGDDRFRSIATELAFPCGV